MKHCIYGVLKKEKMNPFKLTLIQENTYQFFLLKVNVLFTNGWLDKWKKKYEFINYASVEKFYHLIKLLLIITKLI